MPASHPVQLFVVSAPSGTGKTSLNRKLESLPNVAKAITHTTRAPRGVEQNAIDYYFVNEKEFLSLVEHGDMLEYANVFGNLYGTSLNEVSRLQKQGKITILELDVQGWHSVNRLIPTAKGIFIFPPSVTDLWQRLEKRGTDDLKTRLKRILAAKKEIIASDEFQEFVINDDFDAAYSDLKHIVLDGRSGRLSHKKGLEHRAQLLEEFEHDHWLQQLLEQYPELSNV